MKCVRCGKPISNAGVGRPRTYCSVQCRRDQEHELARRKRSQARAEYEAYLAELLGELSA